MTAANRFPLVRAALASALLVVLSTSLYLAAPPSAHAAPKRAKTITSERVLVRAKSWVKDRVSYSQYAYHRGYRQDCSGFVSMAWATGRSYNTRTLDDVSRRISWRRVRPGDAVVTPGHAVVFVKWKNRKARTFYSYEQTTWGGHAERKVRRMTSSARVLRRDGIRNQRRTPVPPRTGVKLLGAPAPVSTEPSLPPQPPAPASASAESVSTVVSASL